ncbi:lipocalin/cytosolic fatty acid-binding protein Karl [Arctopsyche grandis]|uniref:lipocalin/cytosolic fatty acid-binding protein Karl n=1 Tax=Arctopsyche grandis TaxID=121162 RepID=UPI00406D869E
MTKKIVFFIFALSIVCAHGFLRKYREDKTKCPMVKAMRNFELKELLGQWYVIQYYASSEEDLSYKCMRAEFTEDDSISSAFKHMIQITMNFTYIFINDPLNEILLGNITWQVPDHATPAHWVHAEDTYEGIYNTYVLDTDYTSWTLLMHCAEKEKEPRYLSAFIMSRNATIGNNVVSYLRDKLPKYDIDLNFMFEMSQNECEQTQLDKNLPPLVGLAEEAYQRKKSPSKRRHPMKRIHKNTSKEFV